MGLLVCFIIEFYNNKYLYIFIVSFLLIIADFNNSNIFKINDEKNILIIKQWGDPISFKEQNRNGFVTNFIIHDYINSNINYEDLTKEISNYHYLYVYLYDDNFYNYWVDYTGDYNLENGYCF